MITVEKGDLTSSWDLPYYNLINGRISIVYGGSGTEIPIGSSGSVVKLVFTVKEGEPLETSAMVIGQIQISDLEGNVGTVSGKNGIFTRIS